MKLDLNNRALVALKELQSNNERYTALIEDTVDYIIASADVLNPDIDAHNAISLLRYLREFSDLIQDIEETQP